MKKRLLMMLCAGVLAVSCLCGCGGGSKDGEVDANGSEQGGSLTDAAKVENEKADEMVEDNASTKGDKVPSFEGVVEGIQYQVWYNKDLESESVTWLYTNTEEETVSIDGEIIYYDEKGDILETVEISLPCLEKDVPVPNLDYIDAPIGNVELKIEKAAPDVETMGLDLIKYSDEWTEKGVKVTGQNVSSEDKVVANPEVYMVFFRDGEYVWCKREGFEGDRLLPGETKVCEIKSMKYEVDEVSYYLRSDGVFPRERFGY